MRLTELGVQPETFQDHLAALEAAAIQTFGASFSLEPQTPQGQFLSIWALAMAQTDLQAVDLATAFSIQNATGVAADRLAELVGITRETDETTTALMQRVHERRGAGGTSSSVNLVTALEAKDFLSKALVVEDLTNSSLTVVVGKAESAALTTAQKNDVALTILQKKAPGVGLTGAERGSATVGGVTYNAVPYAEAAAIDAKVTAVLKPSLAGLVPANLVTSAIAAVRDRVDATPINTLVTVAALEAAVQRVPGDFELVGDITITREDGTAYNYTGNTYAYATIADDQILVTLQS